MIEVFKTNVNKRAQAEQLVQLIQQTFVGYNANFDLEDCDRILRIKSRTVINSDEVIRLLSRMDISVSVLDETVAPEASQKTQ
ncbi:MAG: hypothetical protein QY309_07380 [Cyclobacteriaceae bacterium]|nr:MAG: hypothetical protein QY309_07380 [Cyclobacteriaceae bacterium]